MRNVKVEVAPAGNGLVTVPSLGHRYLAFGISGGDPKRERLKLR